MSNFFAYCLDAVHVAPTVWNWNAAITHHNATPMVVLLSWVRISKLLELVDISFCSGLLPVLQASTPPSIDWYLVSSPPGQRANYGERTPLLSEA